MAQRDTLYLTEAGPATPVLPSGAASTQTGSPSGVFFHSRGPVSDKPVVLAEDDVSIPEKDPETGRFLSGNTLGGRIKGSRNKITRLRLEMEEALRLNLRSEAESLLEHAIRAAKGGDSLLMKALLDKILTTPKDDEDANKKPESVKVIVVTQNSSDPPKVTVSTARPPVTIENET